MAHFCWNPCSIPLILDPLLATHTFSAHRLIAFRPKTDDGSPDIEHTLSDETAWSTRSCQMVPLSIVVERGQGRGHTKEIVYGTADRIETIRTIPERQPVDPRGASDARQQHPRATDRHPRRRDLHHSCAAFVRHQRPVGQ